MSKKLSLSRDAEGDMMVNHGVLDGSLEPEKDIKKILIILKIFEH